MDKFENNIVRWNSICWKADGMRTTTVRIGLVVSLLFILFLHEAVCDIVMLTQRTQTLQDTGKIRWSVQEDLVAMEFDETAVIIVDMWNKHWCPSATERVQALGVMVNDTVTQARKAGALIIHAPSDCTAYYKNYPERQWVVALKNESIPPPIPHKWPAFPINSSDSGCDIPGYHSYTAWTKETDMIMIYPQDGIIADSSQEIYNVLMAKRIQNVIYVGVDENMCVMTRQFAIPKTLSWGFNALIVRELTDNMYDPTQVPYVEHSVGTALMTAYLEKFWVPSISAFDILNPRNYSA